MAVVAVRSGREQPGLRAPDPRVFGVPSRDADVEAAQLLPLPGLHLDLVAPTAELLAKLLREAVGAREAVLRRHAQLASRGVDLAAPPLVHGPDDVGRNPIAPRPL